MILAGAVAWAAGQGSAAAVGWSVPVLCAALLFLCNGTAFVPAWTARTERYYDLVGSPTYLASIACAVLLAEPDPRGPRLSSSTCS